MGKKVKVVFDTNVWSSIFTHKILNGDYTRAKQKITVYINQDIILEISKVLLYPKIAKIINETNWNRKEVLRAIKVNSTIVQPKLRLHVVEDDFEDNKILEYALATGADFIVSGDKHLQELGKYKKKKILTPREFFDEVIK